MVGRFAGDVSRVEFADGGVQVFEVVHNDVRDPIFVVDLDDVERIVLGRLGVTAGGANSREDEPLSADRNGIHHRDRETDFGGRLQVSDHVASTVLRLGTDDPSMIDADVVVGHRFGHGVPVASREVRPDMLEDERCPVL